MTTTSISGTTPLAHTFNGQTLRHVMIEGEPWFHATDVCRCLGLSVGGGTYHHLRKLDADEKQTLSKSQNQIQSVDVFLGRAASASIINESGLYKLTMRADVASAKPFQNWVTKEILPAIRKTGGYLLNEEARETAHADAKEAMPHHPRKFRGKAAEILAFSNIPHPWTEKPPPPVRLPLRASI